MNTKRIENQLDNLYQELDSISEMSSEDARQAYNADSKAEIISMINSEIEDLEEELHGDDECEDDGMDYINLQASQGLPVTHW